MDVAKMLGELRQERDLIDEVILSLERLAKGRGRRRGRPPSWLVEATRGNGQKASAKPARKPKKAAEAARATSAA